MICDESVKLQELLLELHITNLEIKPSLSLSLIESPLRSEEGHGASLNLYLTGQLALVHTAYHTSLDREAKIDVK